MDDVLLIIVQYTQTLPDMQYILIQVSTLYPIWIPYSWVNRIIIFIDRSKWCCCGIRSKYGIVEMLQCPINTNDLINGLLHIRNVINYDPDYLRIELYNVHITKFDNKSVQY